MNEDVIEINSDFEVTTHSLVTYIKHKLSMKGITFTPTSLDYAVSKRIIGLFRRYDKADATILRFIDECMDKIKGGTVTSLVFLNLHARHKLGLKRKKKKVKKAELVKVELTPYLMQQMERISKKFNAK